MARKKAARKKAAAFESAGEYFIDTTGHKRKETHSQIHESLMQSKAFYTLKPKQQMLYIYCKAQFYGVRKPEHDYKGMPEITSDCFYMNLAQIRKYKLYADSDSSHFYKDMNTLIEHGLIDRVSSGKGQRKKTIYRYSAKWKDYDV